MRTCKIHVDLGAIVSNYKFLSSVASKVCPVVKANSYGIGANKVVEILSQNGADSFFVATLQEAMELRSLFPNIAIFTLLGLHADPKIYADNNIIPVINSYKQLLEIYKFSGNKPGIALQFDTGMLRNGMTYEELKKALSENLLDSLDIKLVMSHLSSSEEAGNPFNKIQLDRFHNFIKHFPTVSKAFANSEGIFLGKEYHFDVVRPGIALYGYIPNNAIKPSVTMYAKILEIHTYNTGETVGYNQTYKLLEPKTLATIGIGYADGISRAVSNVGHVYYGDNLLPVLGRVSMDSMVVDISHCLNSINDDYISIFETKEQMFELASKSQTIPYEILTSIGNRFELNYI